MWAKLIWCYQSHIKQVMKQGKIWHYYQDFDIKLINVSKTSTMLPVAYQTTYRAGILKFIIGFIAYKLLMWPKLVRCYQTHIKQVIRRGILKYLLPRLQPTKLSMWAKLVWCYQSHIKQVIMRGKTIHYYQDFGINYRCDQN